MKKSIWFTALAAVLLVWGCKEKQYLVGYYDYQTFQRECHWDHFTDEKFEPKERWMDSLATLKVKDSLRVQLFLGCYCGDSKKWVPRFFDMKPGLPISQVDIISVDTTKKDEKNLAPSAGVEKIPTFIFYQGSNEVGRIVEKPKGGLERQLFLVLKNCE